jgi:hypothetical protein
MEKNISEKPKSLFIDVYSVGLGAYGPSLPYTSP